MCRCQTAVTLLPGTRICTSSNIHKRESLSHKSQEQRNAVWKFELTEVIHISRKQSNLTTYDNFTLSLNDGGTLASFCDIHFLCTRTKQSFFKWRKNN